MAGPILLVLLLHPRLVARQASLPARFAEVEIGVIVDALELYALDHGGQYPDALAVLAIRDSAGDSYIPSETVSRDPWGGVYYYLRPDPDVGRTEPRVWSDGPDGQPGGGDDVESWTTNKGR